MRGAGSVYLGLDIGGSSVKMGIVDQNGRILRKGEAPVDQDAYRTPILETVIREAGVFMGEEREGIRGIGVSATGQVDDRTGVIIGTNGKIRNYEGGQIVREMQAAFGIPTAALNDANAAVLGEHFRGAARGEQDVIMITLGTGVGGGIIMNGELYGGSRGIAGELGHFTLYQDGAPCACGKRGCYESYASTSALVHEAEMLLGETGLNGRKLFERAEAGEEAVQVVLDRWIDDIAAGLTGLVHIFNPRLLVVGGGVSEQETLLMQPLRERVLRGVMPRFAEGLRLVRAELGNDAGMIGAVRFFMLREGEQKT